MLKAQYGSEGNEIIIQKASCLELDYFVLRFIKLISLPTHTILSELLERFSK